MSSAGNSVIITGHRGFIGHHAADAFIHDGWEVVGAGRPDLELPSERFTAVLRAAAPMLVVHCAGPASVPDAEKRPEEDRTGSLGVVEALLSAMTELPRIPRLLLVSSAAVYGNPAELPVATDAPLTPISTYGRHRVETEHAAVTSGVPTAVARIFSAYGEGLERQVWWDISRSALAGAVVLSGDGTESRDFIHGEDAGRALATIARHGAFDGDVFNVGTGTETTIATLAERLVAEIDPRAPVTFTGAERVGDPRRWRADISALRALGFEPLVSPDEGVERYVRWVKKR